jgi:hypothetical protein
MLRTILIAGFLCASPAAFSQDQTAQDLIAARQQACMDDYEKYCKGVMPGGGRIIACLAKETDRLTPACKKAMTEAEAEKK